MRQRKERAKTFFLALAVVALGVTGNFVLAWGMKHLPQMMGLDPLGYVHAILSPCVALGIGLLTLWMLMRLTLMSWADLSFVLPVTSVGYVLTTVVGKLCLGETVSWHRWLGVMFIFAGSVVVGTTVKQARSTGSGAEQ